MQDENKNADFYLVCHTACNELGNFQWFLKDDPNSEHEVNLENQVYESFSTDSNWIRKNAENKWLGCHCLLKDDEYNEYTEMICHLSSDILPCFAIIFLIWLVHLILKGILTIIIF